MAASLRKKLELAENPTTPLRPSATSLLEPSLTIIGHDHKVYYACPTLTAGKGGVTILGPDGKFADLSTRSVQGIFKLIRFCAGILDYGYQVHKESGQEGGGALWDEYLGRIVGDVGTQVVRGRSGG